MATTSDLAVEREALTTGAALVDRSAAGRLRLGGADRARFLHGLVTCEVKGLVEGQGAYGFVTSSQGRVLADVVVLALADELWLEVPHGADDAVADHLAKYLIADRVEVAALPAVPLAVAGPRAAELLADLLGRGALPDEPWSHRPASLAGVAFRAVRRGIAPVETFDLWLPPGTGPELRARLQAAGAVPVGDEAWDLLRVERGVPAFGRDFGADNFPQETGLGDQAVSYTKGCYLGQEIVARIHYRGGVHKALRGLRFRGVEAPPPTGTPLLADGRAAGTVGTTAVSPDHGAIGLALLHERGNAAGTVLQVEGGGEAEVVELPFG